MKTQFTVSQNGDGDFQTITDAIQHIPQDASAAIYIKNGIYREKLYLNHQEITLIGESPEKTILTWQDGANLKHPDGEKLGTFRSYTVYLGGEKATIKNMTIQNMAGRGEIAGQSLAVYANADFARFENVSFISRQDTIFLAPLPQAPRTAGSFIGPGENAPRKACKDYFENCRIAGDVDFIFGGAEAAFCHCSIFSYNRDQQVNGYVTAASTPADQKYGFIFYDCKLISDCSAGSVYLGRPWREFSNVAFLKCFMDSHIINEGWKLWHPDSNEMNTVRYFEYENKGPGACGKRAPWVKMISPQEAQKYLDEVQRLSQKEGSYQTGSYVC